MFKWKSLEIMNYMFCSIGNIYGCGVFFNFIEREGWGWNDVFVYVGRYEMGVVS